MERNDFRDQDQCMKMKIHGQVCWAQSQPQRLGGGDRRIKKSAKPPSATEPVSRQPEPRETVLNSQRGEKKKRKKKRRKRIS